MTKKNLIILIIGFISIIITVALICYFSWPKVSEKIEFFHPFKNCQVIAESCLDKDCRYLFMCNENEFSDCTVYDCGDKYGVSITNNQRRVINKRYLKSQKAEILKNISKYQGTLEVLEEKCEDEKLYVKLEINTKEECSISKFIVSQENKEEQEVAFEKIEDYYKLTLADCSRISQVIAITEGGGIIKKIIPES